jgi:hypothetical protein
MTDPAHRPEHAARLEQEAAPDFEVLQLAAKVFNLARHGDTGTLAAYVDAGVPANLSNDKGDTLVMLAAYHGHPQTVSALLARGADPGRRNDRGQTPLAGAVFKGERAVIEVLLDAGGDPTAGTPSAVDTARMFGLDDLVALFEGRLRRPRTRRAPHPPLRRRGSQHQFTTLPCPWVTRASVTTTCSSMNGVWHSSDGSASPGCWPRFTPTTSTGIRSRNLSSAAAPCGSPSASSADA